MENDGDELGSNCFDGPCLTLTGKTWRTSLSFRCQHVLSLQELRVFSFPLPSTVHMHFFAPLNTCVLLKYNQT